VPKPVLEVIAAAGNRLLVIFEGLHEVLDTAPAHPRKAAA